MFVEPERSTAAVSLRRLVGAMLCSALALQPMPDDVESEFDLVADAYQSVIGGRRFDSEIVAIDREFANGPHFAS